MEQQFLPIDKKDMEQRGWSQLDFICVSGDAYVDHPSFGPAIITRVLESYGFRVGMISQPDWRNTESFKILGRPRLAFLVTAGNMDSMVNHYTVSKKMRSVDVYSSGGKIGKRPDRATIVYTNKIRQTYKNIPIIIGGIEASLRRFAHYDYWDNKVRRSLLIDSGADLLVYGMGEHQIVEIAEALQAGLHIKDITYINGTCYVSPNLDKVYDYELVESFSNVLVDKTKYALAFAAQYKEQDPIRGKRLVQPHNLLFLVQNPPSPSLSQSEMDRVYSLPYQRTYHPIYDKDGGVPAIQEVLFSITSSRGCFGNCSFCALTFHQGRVIQARSHQSIINEATLITYQPNFKGYIHDVGGPTANFRNPACKKQKIYGTCIDKQCLYPSPCKNLDTDHSDYTELLRKLRAIPHIKKVFIRSGLRFDYLLAGENDTFFYELVEHHISGQLKIAPEHISSKVLALMGKPNKNIYEQFVQKYEQINQNLNKVQYLIPYFMSSHPGSDLHAAIELAEYLRDSKSQPEQVQDFYPTPGTLSTCMFYTELDPRTMARVYVPKQPREKAMQRALLQYRKPVNYSLIYEALIKAGRDDLIGFGKNCLIQPHFRKPAGHMDVGKNKDTAKESHLGKATQLKESRKNTKFKYQQTKKKH